MADISGISLLPARTVLSLSGAERAGFLDGLLSTGVKDLAPGTLAYGALLTPQGKIISDMMIFAFEDRLALDVPADAAADLERRLTMYKLRAAVTLERTGEDVGIGFGDAEPQGARPDPRAPGLGTRFLAPAGTLTADEAVLARYRAARVAAGVPDAVADFDLADTFPHDANMDLTGGVDFKKGCFVGQEVVSRMRHRGTARRRIVIVSGDGPLPEPGTPVTSGEKVIGRMGTSQDGSGLALIRIDRTDGTAMAAGIPLRLRAPAGAPFALAGD